MQATIGQINAASARVRAALKRAKELGYARHWGPAQKAAEDARDAADELVQLYRESITESSRL